MAEHTRVCARCRKRRAPEDYIGHRGKIVSHCLHCREKARMFRQEKKDRHATGEKYALEYCPWYAGEIRVEKYGGQGLI